MTKLERLIAQADLLALSGEPLPVDLEAALAAEGVLANDINDYEDNNDNG